MLSVPAFFSQWHMSNLFFVLHHRWRKNSSQWGIYRYQPSGNFEENQRGHRKKRQKSCWEEFYWRWGPWVWSWTGAYAWLSPPLAFPLKQALLPAEDLSPCYQNAWSFSGSQWASWVRLWYPPIRDNRSQICTCSVHHVRKLSLVRDAITTTSQQAKKSKGRQCKRPMDDHKIKTTPPSPPENSVSYEMWEELCVLLPQKCGRENRCLGFANWLHAGCPMNPAAPP